MAKNKSDESEIVEDVNVFPEGHRMHSWDGMSSSTPEYELERSRGHNKHNAPNEQKNLHEGIFHIRPEWRIEGMQMAWLMERLLNEPQGNNLEKAWHKGWRPVKKEECSWLQFEDYPDFLKVGQEDGIVRKCGMMLMKMPQDQYNRQQESYRQEGEDIQRQSNELTAYLSDTSGPVKHKMYENNSSFEPSYKHR